MTAKIIQIVPVQNMWAQLSIADEEKDETWYWRIYFAALDSHNDIRLLCLDEIGEYFDPTTNEHFDCILYSTENLDEKTS